MPGPLKPASTGPASVPIDSRTNPATITAITNGIARIPHRTKTSPTRTPRRLRRNVQRQRTSPDAVAIKPLNYGKNRSDRPGRLVPADWCVWYLRRAAPRSSWLRLVPDSSKGASLQSGRDVLVLALERHAGHEPHGLHQGREVFLQIFIGIGLERRGAEMRLQHFARRGRHRHRHVVFAPKLEAKVEILAQQLRRKRRGPVEIDQRR